MSAQKNIQLLLSEEEAREFKAFLKAKKMGQQELADEISMSKSQTGVLLRANKIPKLWKRYYDLKELAEDLQSRLDKIIEASLMR